MLSSTVISSKAITFLDRYGTTDKKEIERMLQLRLRLRPKTFKSRLYGTEEVRVFILPNRLLVLRTKQEFK